SRRSVMSSRNIRVSPGRGPGTSFVRTVRRRWTSTVSPSARPAQHHVEELALERELHQARGQSRRIYVEVLAGGLVGGEETAGAIDEQRHHGCVFDQVLERVQRSGVGALLDGPAPAIPDHWREYRFDLQRLHLSVG